MRRALVSTVGMAWVVTLAADALPAQTQSPTVKVTFIAAAHPGPVTGRVILVVARDSTPEPRLLVSPSGPAIFGIDVEQWRPGQPVTIDNSALGYPGQLGSLPPGDYWIQPVVDVYQQVHRSDGHTIWVHFNDRSQEVVQIAVGNLYGDTVKVHLGPGVVLSLTAVQQKFSRGERAKEANSSLK